MSLELHPDSHTHGLPSEIIAYVLERFADREGFFRETIELPESLPMLSCGLFGPAMGEGTVTLATYTVRGKRSYASRVTSRTPRPTRLLTVIAGPHDGRACVLYTVHGGPIAPREPGDPAIASWEELVKAREFWAEHALSVYCAE